MQTEQDRSLHYRLNDQGEPEPCTALEWALWFEKAERHVAEDWIGPAYVSTVFLGLDHSFSGTDAPVLWESMIFWPGHSLDQEQRRYHSRALALAGHAELCARVWAAQEPTDV
jgi:hypothetical protein